MFSGATNQDLGDQSLQINKFKENAYKLVLPAMLTAFCGTFTYPIAVGIARKLFKLRGFYAIHLSIAPFLAYAHINIFSVFHTYGHIKFTEGEYERLQPYINKNKSD